MKEDFMRRVLLVGIEEESLHSLPEFGGWRYQGEKDYRRKGGYFCYSFTNKKIGCEVLFTKEDSCFVSLNVLPINAENFNQPRYRDGFDSAEEQMADCTKDALFHFCVEFNVMAEEENEKDENQGNRWRCALIPSARDRVVCQSNF